jgi:hypothetical protein
MRPTKPDKATLKARAVDLLERYDTMRMELRTLERELQHAVREFAFADGAFLGMTTDSFRMCLEMERERLEREAERDNWEKHNA